MTTFNDYLSAGLRAFEQWRPRLEERLARTGNPVPDNHTVKAGSVDLSTLQSEPVLIPPLPLHELIQQLLEGIEPALFLQSGKAALDFRH